MSSVIGWRGFLCNSALAFIACSIVQFGGCVNDQNGAVESARGEKVRGALVIVGGGGTPASVVARAIELAGGAECRVVVLPQASMRANAGEDTADMFRDAGVVDVRVLKFAEVVADNRVDTVEKISGTARDTIDRRAFASSAGVDSATASGIDKAVEQLGEADLIWFPGGDQNRLMRRLNNAGIAELIRQRHRDGCVVGGTSAGAAVMSERMITGEADLESIRRGGTQLAGGLGLWPGVIVDQHFLKRRRFNRLYSAILDRPALVGVGIDERTAVIVSGDRIEVMGDGSAMIVDARRAEVSAGADGQTVTATNVRVDVIAPGGLYRPKPAITTASE